MIGKKFTLQAVTQGRVHKVTFIVDKEDAHIVRSHGWTLRKDGDRDTFHIVRKDGKITLGLSHEITGAPHSERVLHKNDDLLDFRRENLLIIENVTKKQRELCEREHDKSPDNFYIQPNGYRYCKQCGADAVQRYRARKKAAASLAP